MKYKGKIEINKEEMDCLFGWLEKFIKLDRELARSTVEISETAKKILKSTTDSQEENSDEEDSLDWEEADGDSEENIEEVHEPLQMPNYKEQVSIDKGKKVAKSLFDTWLINFDQEGEQPPRGQIIEDLGKTIEGRYLYRYMKHEFDKGNDTTLIIRDLVDESIPNNTVRFLAENFTQVTSVLFHQLSDFLRYPNPLDQEEI